MNMVFSSHDAYPGLSGASVPYWHNGGVKTQARANA
jgi:hypothetical protein